MPTKRILTTGVSVWLGRDFCGEHWFWDSNFGCAHKLRHEDAEKIPETKDSRYLLLDHQNRIHPNSHAGPFLSKSLPSREMALEVSATRATVTRFKRSEHVSELRNIRQIDQRKFGMNHSELDQKWLNLVSSLIVNFEGSP